MTDGKVTDNGGDVHTPGRTYEVTTITDLINLSRGLPDDRREVMLSEMVSGIRLAGAHLNLLEALGAEVSTESKAMTWTDDDEGNLDVNTFDQDGEPFLSLKAKRK